MSTPGASAPDDRVAHVVREVDASGFAVMRNADAGEFSAILGLFGAVIHVEDVDAGGTGPALVSSRHGLSPHTDHHAAQHIVWRCVAQADQGGDSIVVDGIALFRALPEHHRRALQGVVLAEHNIFDGDLDEHPMITWDGEEPHIYYSYWLARDKLTGAEREAFETFANALEVVPAIRIRLQASDVLVVNNHRMLHGRTAIRGTSRRLLVRYWLAPQEILQRRP